MDRPSIPTPTGFRAASFCLSSCRRLQCWRRWLNKPERLHATCAHGGVCRVDKPVPLGTSHCHRSPRRGACQMCNTVAANLKWQLKVGSSASSSCCQDETSLCFLLRTYKWRATIKLCVQLRLNQLSQQAQATISSSSSRKNNN